MATSPQPLSATRRVAILATADTGGTESEIINDIITLNDFILSNDSAIPLTPPICNYLAPDSNTTLIVDTGCSGHCDAYNIDKKNVPVITPLNVLLPNGSHMSSTHTKHLSIPTLPPAACLQHQFLAMKTTVLLSIGQLCDHGCSATFSQHHLVTVSPCFMGLYRLLYTPHGN